MALIKSAEQILASIVEVPVRMGRPPLNRKCELPGCTNRHYARGLCWKHDYTKTRWGDPFHVWKPAGNVPGQCGCPTHMPKRESQ